MRELTVGSLFAGIGGFDLGLERAGMKVSWQIEIDEFCNAVLAKHWPNVPRFRDIKEVKIEQLDKVDIICGGFPCQPFSAAGKKRGADDNRYLWPEMLRIIQGIHPAWVIGENVPGIINLALEDVCLDLEKEDYEVQPLIIPACSVNAPHKRERVWIVANRNGKWKPQLERQVAKEWRWIGNGFEEAWLQAATRICRVDDGLPRRMDRAKRLKALGNAVVPQIVEIIGKAIMEVERIGV